MVEADADAVAPTAAGSAAAPAPGGGLSAQDARLVRLYMTACFSQWDALAPVAREFLAAGGAPAALRGALRHLVVLAGYGPCLAATLALQRARVLPPDAPAKVGGPPGDAFELVYATVAGAVRRKVHAADPALGEWIRLHLYGDVYSSPGLSLRRKQLLMCARLGEADMQEQLFGHALAALRFGASRAALEEALRLAFALSPVRKDAEAARSRATLALAAAKFEKDYAGAAPGCPEVTVPDPASVLVPRLYEAPPEALYDDRPAGGGARAAGGPPSGESARGDGGGAGGGEAAADEQLFAWEEVDPRFDQSAGRWRD
jgi:alkylhydroperoxidase/carboxymuconolactone decarboxylase family protein YurZ